MEDDIIMPTKYSKTKTTSYEKKLIKILSEDNGNDDDDKNIIKIRKKRNCKRMNDNLLGDIAFEMSNISSDELLVSKYIKRKMKYMIRNTICNSIDKLELVPDYEKKDLNSNIGLKLSLLDEKILEDITGNKIEKDNSKKFYEMVLKYNNNDKKRKFCVHLCSA